MRRIIMTPRICTRLFSTTPLPKTIAIFGGTGYVGSHIVKAATSAGHNVLSISRGGKPAHAQHHEQITWVGGDITKAEDWAEHLKKCDAVVSCVGAFGSNERINGDANINAISEAARQGVPRFIFVSTVENNLPSFVLRGYFEGKRRAEQALLDAFPAVGAGIVLRPGFMYGARSVPLPFGGVTGSGLANSVDIPLGLLGRPLEILLDNPVGRSLRSSLPGMLAPLAPPIDVDAVAAAVLALAVGDEAALAVCAHPRHSQQANVLSVGDIKEVAETCAGK